MTSTDIVPITRTTCTDVEVAPSRPRISPVLIAACVANSLGVIVALIYAAMGGF